MANLTLYLDECVDHTIIPHLEARGYVVTSVQHQGTGAAGDAAQLRYARRWGWVILTTNRGHFQRQHRLFMVRGEQHCGIITLPQDDRRPDRFALRCAMLAGWVSTAFDTPSDRLFRWTDLQQALQQGYVLHGFGAEEIARALGNEEGM